MRRSLSLLAIAVGSGLLVASALAEPHRRAPSVLRVSLAGTDFDYTDPALAYSRPAWSVGYATCLKLMNYPDAPAPKGLRAIPEASLPPRVSRNGRRYTFAIRRGFRFNTGERVTPESFAKALYRALSPKMNSPGSAFISDVVGAKAVIANRARRARGIRVRGRSLIVDLVRPVPDFLQRIALPFFCATAKSVPAREGGVTVLPAAGPYFVAARRLHKSAVLRRNRFYRGRRPHRIDAIVYLVQQSEDDSLRDVGSGRADWAAGALPRRAYRALARRYGVKHGRFRVSQTSTLAYLGLDTSRPPLSDRRVRRALNLAIDRRLLAGVQGPFYGTATDELLPPSLRGPADAKLYPLSVTNASLAEARRLTRGRLGDGKVQIRPGGCLLCRPLREQLARIGLDVSSPPTGCLECPPHIAVAESTTPYPDAGAFLRDVLDLTRYHVRPHAGSLAEVRRLSALRGERRLRAYRRLAVSLARAESPIIPLFVRNDRDFFSARVGCVTYQPVYGIDLAALCLR